MLEAPAITRKELVGLLLTCIFVISFVPYITKVTTATLLLGPASLILLAWLGVLFIFRRHALQGFSALRRRRALLFIVVMPILPTGVAIVNGDWRSVLYALLMSATLASAQVLLAVLNFERIVNALAQAAVVCVPLFVIDDGIAILRSAVGASRLIPSTAQPNAIAFIFVGFSLAGAWQLLNQKSLPIMRVVYAGTICAAVGVIFVASSRASLLALGLAATGAALLYAARSLKNHRTPWLLPIAFAVCVLVVLALVIARTQLSYDIFSYVSKALALDSSQRGIDSGLSGRTIRWEISLRAIATGGTWLLGTGYRTSGPNLGFSVDNGYLIVWYECGLVGLLLVVGQFIWILNWCRRRYINGRGLNGGGRMLLGVAGFATVFLVNNFFDRYLFGLGNPFSLFGLFFLLLNRADLDTIAKNARRSRPALGYNKVYKWPVKENAT